MHLNQCSFALLGSNDSCFRKKVANCALSYSAGNLPIHKNYNYCNSFTACGGAKKFQPRQYFYVSSSRYKTTTNLTITGGRKPQYYY